MKEAREAASFETGADVGIHTDEAAERIARHRKTGGLLADLLDDIAAKNADHAETAA